MKPWTAILAVSSIVLAGCAATVGSRVQPGMTEAQVRAVGGRPVHEQKTSAGETAWIYTLQPSGYFTWRVTFDRDGRVREVRNLTTSENFQNITPGMTESDVEAIMGPTFIREKYWTGNYSISYRYMEDATFMMLTVLMSKDGRVTSFVFEPDGVMYDAVSDGQR
jgi:outer membrane protein assembly factor BamE (lipoprotein component of BamABCDE complex)